MATLIFASLGHADIIGTNGPSPTCIRCTEDRIFYNNYTDPNGSMNLFVVGRKTWDTMKRLAIKQFLTRDYAVVGRDYLTFEQAIAKFNPAKHEKMFIIGGAEIYSRAFDEPGLVKEVVESRFTVNNDDVPIMSDTVHFPREKYNNWLGQMKPARVINRCYGTYPHRPAVSVKIGGHTINNVNLDVYITSK